MFLFILMFNSFRTHFKQIKCSHFIYQFCNIVWIMDDILSDFAFLDILLIILFLLLFLMLFIMR